MQVNGKITYNGETFDKFVPQRTASYVDQVRNAICIQEEAPEQADRY